MNQMDERELSLAVIDPVAPGMIQNSFGHSSTHPHPPFVQYTLKGFENTCSLAHLV